MLAISNACSYVAEMSLSEDFDHRGASLAAVEFCAVDLETTGASPADCAITEIGAIKVKRGEVTGTFHSLVKPRQSVPAFVRLLTGINDHLLVDAPPIESVLPSFLEFSRHTVLVAHNARFDVSFLNSALERAGYPRIDNRVVDTAGLARKVLAGEVPNRKLDTLARHLRCAHLPTHRAYTDALATIDVLHCLIERLAGFGVTTLEDLLLASVTRLDGTFSKIRLTEGLPAGIGVYRFVGATGKTLYVGKATDHRSRVRSYFYGDPRRGMRNLLRETQSVVAERHATTLEAEVAEVRTIFRELPPYNTVGKRRGAWYLKVSAAAKNPRIGPCRVPKDDGSAYVGPFASMRMVRTLIETLRDACRVHRCTDPSTCRGCAVSEMGTCAGEVPELHRREIQKVIDGVTKEPALLLEPLTARIHRLAAARRFEEAAEARARAALFQKVVATHLRIVALVEAGDVLLAIGSRAILIRRGRVVGGADLAEGVTAAFFAPVGTAASPVDRGWFTAERYEEARVISSWIDRHSAEVRLLHVDGSLSLPAGCGPARFQPARRSAAIADRSANSRDESRPAQSTLGYDR